MPKEITHWIIALETASRLGSGGEAGKAIADRTEAYLLGAVAHDGPYYARKDPLMALAGDRLHGRGVDDAFACVKRAVTTRRAGDGIKPPPSAIAFAAGALTHIAADIVFHPAVFYFTGFPSHPDRRIADSYMYRHWGFEAALDMHYLSERGKGSPRKTARLYRHALKRDDADELLEAIARFYATGGETPSVKAADAVMRGAGRTQGLFGIAPLRLLAKILNAPQAGKNADASAAFYARRGPWEGWMSGEKPFKDPVTGEDGIFEVGACFDSAVNTALGFMRRLESSLSGDARAFPLPGPCLDTGMPLDDGRIMRHCDPRLLGGA